MALNPQETYVHLGDQGRARELAGGAAFWGLSDAEMAAHGPGWLLSEFEFSEDWSSWELHPAGDELIYLLSGAVEIDLQADAEGAPIERLSLAQGRALCVPQGFWHTARTQVPSRMLFITRGEGTRHRPVRSSF